MGFALTSEESPAFIPFHDLNQTLGLFFSYYALILNVWSDRVHSSVGKRYQQHYRNVGLLFSYTSYRHLQITL